MPAFVRTKFYVSNINMYWCVFIQAHVHLWNINIYMFITGVLQRFNLQLCFCTSYKARYDVKSNCYPAPNKYFYRKSNVCLSIKYNSTKKMYLYSFM